MKKRALISVFDKSGVTEFAAELVKLGYDIISTGGTSATLRRAGIEVINVSDMTGFPECLDGRVKTLHPMIHAGILAMRNNAEHMEQLSELGVAPIDIVAINLYPFQQTILRDDVTLPLAIENIDIGGPTMIRAAAKNWQDVCVIVDPADYPQIIEDLKNGGVDRETKFTLARKVFQHTANYDALISSYLNKVSGDNEFKDTFTVTYQKQQDLRYGENPHQKAAFYREIGKTYEGTLVEAEQLWGKEMSYNNINDANGALDVIKEFNDTPCAVAVKHTNPCGVGIGKTIYDAYMTAYESDPKSIYGGIVALNRCCDFKTAQELSKIFLEIIIAPSYTPEALEVLKKKQNIRLLLLPEIAKKHTPDMLDFKKVAGGLLVQEPNLELVDESSMKVVTKRQPTKEEMEQLINAMRVVKHTKSNAIVLYKGNGTIGIGPGQTNRVTALNIAISYAGEKAKGSVLASDAFFPFGDSVETANAAGVTAIIQPGGSIHDQESIDLCDKYGIAMVFTGIRHFKH